jgi:hypothetical protein
MSAPVGQAWTHSPQDTQVEPPIGSSKSKMIFSFGPRSAMPMTSLTWTSRQARTHRPQWMQRRAARPSPGGRSRPPCSAGRPPGKRLSASSIRSDQVQNIEFGVVRAFALGLVREQQLEDELARGFRALGRALHLHAGRRACGCRTRPAPARPRSRPCRRGNCRPAGSRASSSSRGAGCPCRAGLPPARSSRPVAPRPPSRRA